MNLDKVQLDNKLETLFIDAPGSTFSTVQIWFRAGSALEDKDDYGIAHFLEHMFFKGTPTRPGSKIAHEIESYGGEVNAFTSFDYTCYYINSPQTNLTQSVDILMDMVSNPEFKNEELVPERGVVFEEFRRSLDNPNQYAFAQLQKTCFQGGYAHQILGTEKTIKNFSREQLVKFREKFYNLSNALLVVAGDLSKDNGRSEIERIVNNYSFPQGEKTSFKNFQLKKAAQAKVHLKDVEQCVLYMAIQAPLYNTDDAAAQDIAINCLAYGEMSPLYKRLVHETSLATGISGSTLYLNKGGTHFLRIACPLQNLSKVYNEANKVIAKTLKSGFNQEDVNRIKNQYIASKVYEKESLESYSFSLGHSFVQTGDLESEQEFINKMRGLTAEQVSAALKDIFANSIQASLQAPNHANKKQLETDLKNFSGKINKLQSAPTTKPKASKEKLAGSKFDPEVKIVELKKGIQFLYRQNTMTPTFVLHAYIKGGLTEESPKNNGLHYLTGQLMTKGYKGQSFDKLKKELDLFATSLSGFSGKNAYGLTSHGQSEFKEKLFDHFFGTLLTPNYPAKFLKIEKEMISRNLDNQEKDPAKQCFKNFTDIIFGKHPYSLNIIGTKDSLKKIKRQDIIDNHQKNLRNKDMLITYCGDLSFDEAKKMVEARLSSLKARGKKKPKSKVKIPSVQGKEIQVPFDREQTHIFIGRSTFALGNKNDLFLKMLTSHLSGQSSELFVKVRDQMGLCYVVQPVHFTALEGGFWGLYIAAGHDKAQSAIDAILEIVNRLRDEGLGEEDFNRVKAMIEGQEQLNIQTNDDYANTYSVPLLQGLGVDFYYQNNRKIQDIGRNDFNKFLDSFLKTKWNIVQVGRE